VVDDWRYGIAAGGIRTRAYPTVEAAIEDAAALARAMTLKSALGGVPVGGGKIVVLDHPGLNRPAAFARLGAFVQELGGAFRTAGDLGTTSADLEVMARECEYVNTTERDLSAATGRSVLRCIEACAEVAGRGGIAGLTIAIQGCGDIGGAVARALSAAGAELIVADVVDARAQAIAAETGARVIEPDRLWSADCDVLSPCALGGALTEDSADAIRAWAVCGGANNICASPEAERRLAARGVLFVPDVVSSAGAVVLGVSRKLLQLADPNAQVDTLGHTAAEILRAARDAGRLATDVAHERAWAHLAAQFDPR
jgi:leucine dehydrogenase